MSQCDSSELLQTRVVAPACFGHKHHPSVRPIENAAFALQGKPSIPSLPVRTWSKARLSICWQLLSASYQITKVQLLQLKIQLSTCRENFRLPLDLTKRTGKLEFRFASENFRLHSKSPRYSFYK